MKHIWTIAFSATCLFVSACTIAPLPERTDATDTGSEDGEVRQRPSNSKAKGLCVSKGYLPDLLTKLW